MVKNTKVSSIGQGWFKDPKVENKTNKTHTRQGHVVDQLRGGGSKARQRLGLNRDLLRNRNTAEGSRPFVDAG